MSEEAHDHFAAQKLYGVRVCSYAAPHGCRNAAYGLTIQGIDETEAQGVARDGLIASA